MKTRNGKITSPWRLAANRRNAQKSTGPKTPVGRAVSKMNAVKHGILSKEVVVRGLHIKESRREFAALHQRFRDELLPAGPLEEMLVDQIVTTHWRLRRALTAESGEIVLSVDESHWERSRGPDPSLQCSYWQALEDPIHTMEDSAAGIHLLERSLGEVRTAVEQEGELTEAAIQQLVNCFGGRPNSLTRELDRLRMKLQANPEGLEPALLREQQKTQALAFLNRRLSTFSWGKARFEEREENAEVARQAADVLPAAETLEKILRYETKLERQLYRAMNQLERLQRMRQGESVPPPLTLEVSERS